MYGVSIPQAGGLTVSRAARKYAVRGALAVSLCALASPVLPIQGAASAEEFVPGSASARADTLKLAAQVGGIDVGLSIGRSVASYQGGFAAGDGRALDLEALPFLIGEVTACEGVAPLLPDASLPEQTLVESTQAGSEASHRTQTFFPEVKGGQSFMPAGWQDASATNQPWATASTQNPSQAMGLFTLYNPTTEVTTQIVDGVREATAVMRADGLSILGGLMTLKNIEWHAVARSGADELVEGEFTVEYGTLFGLLRSSEQAIGDLAGFGGFFRQALGFLGAAVDLPKVVIEGPRVEVTPLVFRFTDLPIGKHVIGPLFDFFNDTIEQYYADLQASGCEGQSNAQLIQLAEDLLRGHGSIVLPIGGVLVSTDDTAHVPIDLSGPSADPVETVTAAAPEAADATASALPDLAFPDSGDFGVPFDTSFDLGTADLGGDFVVDPVPVETSGSVEVSDAVGAPPDEVAAAGSEFVPSGSSKTLDGETGGIATAIGALTVLAALVLGFGDRATMLRSRRRVIADE